MTRALIIMTRIPEEGKTKTRLMPKLTATECVNLHLCFLKDLSSTIMDLSADTFLYYTPKKDTSLLQEIFPHAKGSFLQEGEDLGERMHHGLRTLLKDYDQVLLMGSDVPEVTREDLKEAYAMLEKKDVVLGPSEDGGYYLVGLKKECPLLFKDKIYSTPTVLKEALETLEHVGLSYGLITALRDVDYYEDLLALNQRLTTGHTKHLLEEILDS